MPISHVSWNLKQVGMLFVGTKMVGEKKKGDNARRCHNRNNSRWEANRTSRRVYISSDSCWQQGTIMIGKWKNTSIKQDMGEQHKRNVEKERNWEGSEKSCSGQEEMEEIN